MIERELILSCEHGGNQVPDEYAELFAKSGGELASHRGFDAGALEVAEALAARHRAPLVAATTTRLLVDLNRSLHHRKLYSEFSRGLSAVEKRELLRRHYFPHRNRVEGLVGEAVNRGDSVLHVAAHSFTPVLFSHERNADIGLLYDPSRPAEQAVADAWRTALCAVRTGWAIRRNYPYRGTADGLTTELRTRYADGVYAGLELEVNQRLVGAADWQADLTVIAATLGSVLAPRRLHRGR